MVNPHYFWAFLERVAPLAISFVVSIIIARMVGPEAYGLVAMLAIFMALGQAFTELGFGAALVQRKDITADDETSVFVINLVAGLLITAILCAASPLVASFFGQEILIQLLCVQALGIFIASTGLVQFAQISRQMKFRLGAMIEVVATIVSGVVGISMAYAGFGVWSLVGLGLSREIVRAAAAWIVVGWRPRGRFSRVRVAAMWDYCSKLLYASLLHRIVTNLHSVIIGKIFAPAALGLYARASGLQALPVGVVTGIVQRVAFPLFSKHQDNKVFLLQSIRKQNRLLVLIASLMMGLLAVLAEDLIPWLLGPSWAGAVPLLEILCLAGVFSAAFPLHSQMTMALGESSIFFKVELLKKLAIVIVLAIVYRFGLEAFAWGAVAISFADYMLSAFPNTKLLGYSWRMQFVDLAPPILLSGIPALVLFTISWEPAWPALTLMALKTLSFLAMTAVGLAIFRRSFFHDAWTLVWRFFQATVTRLKWA
jgi:O-antigen/teichoic acid export membrane protein